MASAVIEVERSVVFRDADWGLGMFDDDDVRAVVVDKGIWLMRGTNLCDIAGRAEGLSAIEARSVALVLLKAAEELEGQE